MKSCGLETIGWGGVTIVTDEKRLLIGTGARHAIPKIIAPHAILSFHLRINRWEPLAAVGTRSPHNLD